MTFAPDQELRVLVATDVLSEGQNLQDAFIIVNFDLPWTIIRLIQRAGRVDRIGQKSDKILCYSFLPADGIETSSIFVRRCERGSTPTPKLSEPMNLFSTTISTIKSLPTCTTKRLAARR